MGRRQRLAQQTDESLEEWLRRRTVEGTGIPIDPRMTLELYDRVAALEKRLNELEPNRPSLPGGSELP
jgi:hypothetical protein